MTDHAVTRRAEPVQLDASVVLKEAWSLYKRLFARSLGIGAIVFGIAHFFDVVPGGGFLLALITLVLAFAGTALVQGGLVEIVRGLHVDGDDDPSLAQVLTRAGTRIGKLVAVSLLTGIGIAFGFLLLIVPGLILATRWAVAVPVAMLEDASATGALRRSSEIVRGNGRAVFKVVLSTGLVTVLFAFLLGMITSGYGPFAMWLGATLGSALTAPFTAHALTVVYYTLRDPGRPVALPPGQRRQPTLRSEDETTPPTIDDEYDRRFDERQQRWGE